VTNSSKTQVARHSATVRLPRGSVIRAPHRRRRKPQPIPAAKLARQRVAAFARAALKATPAGGRTSPPGGLWGRRAGPGAPRRADRRAMARRLEAPRERAPTVRLPRISTIATPNRPIAPSGDDGAPLGLRLAPSADRRRCGPPLAGRWRGQGCGEASGARPCALPYASPCGAVCSAASRSAISSGWLRLMGSRPVLSSQPCCARLPGAGAAQGEAAVDQVALDLGHLRHRPLH